MQIKRICQELCARDEGEFEMKQPCGINCTTSNINCCFECISVYGENKLPCPYGVKGLMDHYFKYILLYNKAKREGYLNE